MKKFMFMLAAAAVAAVAQAATVNWKCTNVYAGNASEKVTGVAYFLTTDMLSYGDAQALAGKGASAITAALGAAYCFNGSDGVFTVAAPGVENGALGLEDGKGYSAYLIIFDGTSITDDSRFYLTAVKDLTTYTGADDAALVSWMSQASASKQAGSWHSASDVPEPTSALLMLVGLAGLALRRRRA